MTVEIFKTLLAKDGIVPDFFKMNKGVILIKVLGISYFSVSGKWEVVDMARHSRVGMGTGDGFGLSFFMRCIRQRQFLHMLKVGDEVIVIDGDRKRRCIVSFIHCDGHFVSFEEVQGWGWSTSILWFDLSERVWVIKK